MSKKHITVKVKFVSGIEMLFGNSYRTWDDQLEEYCGMTRQIPEWLTYSPQPWVSFGGLKWCAPENFQGQLDKEGKGRKAESFIFSDPTNAMIKIATRIRKAAERRARTNAIIERDLAAK